MRIDQPQCSFKNCRNQFDGNCKDKIGHEQCSYRRAVQTLEEIIKAQRLCVLCMERGCSNGGECVPNWSGSTLGGDD